MPLWGSSQSGTTVTVSGPTVNDVLTGAQSLLGDTAAEVYTTSMLSAFFGDAYREMYDLFVSWKLGVIQRDAYFVVPAYTSIVTPVSVGINDIWEPRRMWECATGTSVGISSIANTTPIQVTTAGSLPFSNNSIVYLYDVTTPSSLNDRWFATVTGSNTFTLNGTQASGVGNNGIVLYTSDTFSEISQKETLPQFQPSTSLGYWKWQADAFYFIGATQDRLVWVQYDVSGYPPVSGAIGVANSLNFLKYRTAAKAAESRDELARAQRLNLEALGKNMVPDGSGGYLRALALPIQKQQQFTHGRKLPFRPRRNNLLRPWV